MGFRSGNHHHRQMRFNYVERYSISVNPFFFKVEISSDIFSNLECNNRKESGCGHFSTKIPIETKKWKPGPPQIEGIVSEHTWEKYNIISYCTKDPV